MKAIGKVGATLFFAACALPAAAAEWTFGVYLDGKRIGEHRYTIERDAVRDTARVTSDARFDVKVLMVPVFSYRHTADEEWQDGCLVTLETRTRVNGKDYAVSGRRADDAFQIDVAADGTSRQDRLPACVATYAYWDADLLRRHGELLNGQTGAYQPIARSIEDDTDGSAALLRLAGDDFRIELSYRDRDGFWTGLRTTTQDGRTLDYRLENAAAATL
jgi:hypothetical protein